jgi:hypothetical protein
MEYHINLHMKMSKMGKCNNVSNKINVKMTSMYNKLWKKQDQLFFIILVGSKSYLHEGENLSN